MIENLIEKFLAWIYIPSRRGAPIKWEDKYTDEERIRLGFRLYEVQSNVERIYQSNHGGGFPLPKSLRG